MNQEESQKIIQRLQDEKEELYKTLLKIMEELDTQKRNATALNAEVTQLSASMRYWREEYDKLLAKSVITVQKLEKLLDESYYTAAEIAKEYLESTSLPDPYVLHQQIIRSRPLKLG